MRVQRGQDFTRRGKPDHTMGPWADHIGFGKPLKPDNEHPATRPRHRPGDLPRQRAATGQDTHTAWRRA